MTWLLRRRTFLGLLGALLAARPALAQEPAESLPEPQPEPPPAPISEVAPVGAAIDAAWSVGGPNDCASSLELLPHGVVGGTHPRRGW